MHLIIYFTTKHENTTETDSLVLDCKHSILVHILVAHIFRSFQLIK